ncbi:MAG TPA: ATP-binding cassette domain-containing protein [Verrucomicrobiae bacterium]|jgi:phospholipid/cholesterol/gamma-HCH transport system ATP-binding protein
MDQKSQNGEPLLNVVDASVTPPRARRVIASEVNWQVMVGEFWLVGGRHGSGKTSFLATMAGLQRPAAGSIRHFGMELSELSEPELLRERERVGYVFKSGGRMFSGLTVAENVELPLRYHREGENEKLDGRVREVLEATELSREADSTAQSLGWDRQQRVGLARALAMNPELLFLDEPLSGLEARDRNWWKKFLNTLWEGCPLTGGRRTTMIITTNDFGTWAGGGHRCGLLEDGRWQPRDEKQEWPDLA